jgi:hypothetical protein
MSSLDRIKGLRPDLNFDDNLSMDMIGGDMAALGAHFAIGVFLITIFESGIFRCILNYIPLILKKNRIPEKKDLELDEDVKIEDERLNSS